VTKVYIREADGTYSIEDGAHKGLLPDARSENAAAMAILTDALGDKERASRAYLRFKWRLNMENTIGKPFRLSHVQVMSMVADIEQVEKETRMSRIIVERERPPVVNDRGGGVVWDKEHK